MANHVEDCPAADGKGICDCSEWGPDLKRMDAHTRAEHVAALLDSLTGADVMQFSHHIAEAIAAAEYFARMAALDAASALSARLNELRMLARDRIQQCRRDEQKFGAGSISIEAATERRVWQAVLACIDKPVKP